MIRIVFIWLDAIVLLSGFSTQGLISLFAIYNRLSKRPSSKIVETVRCRHFSASLAAQLQLVAQLR